MKFKLDENLGTRTQQLFRDAGYDITIDGQLWIVKVGRIRIHQQARGNELEIE